MKRICLILVFLFCSYFSEAQPGKIDIAIADTLYSKILNEKRPLRIYVPESQSFGIYTQKNNEYPVLFLLDAEWHFLFTAGMIHQLSSINGNTICPEMIIVGIDNIDRARDFTPSFDPQFATSGGYDKFISFIEKELIPYINSAYRVKPYRILMGHSLGGLAVIKTLLQHKELFNAYIALDPSMWWQNQSFLKESEIILVDRQFTDRTLFLGLANSMEKGMDTVQVKRDNQRSTLHIRSALEFSKYLSRNKNNQLKFKFNYYENETHASLPLIGTYDALHFLFSFYNLPLTYKDYADTSMNLVYKIENHYKNISHRMGYIVSPPELTIYSLASTALMKNEYSKAKYLFELNIKNYPDSFNAFDSYGDYLLAVKDEKNAFIMFSKALSIMENAATREKLVKLSGNVKNF